MAIKIKKKVDAPEGDPLLNQPDQFLQTADQSLSWAAENQSKIIIAVGAVLVVVLVGVFAFQAYKSGKAETSTELTAALEVLTAPVGDDQPTDKPATGPTFATAKQKYTDLDAKAGAALTKLEGQPAGDVARLMKARAAFGLGKYDEAVGHYEKWLSTHPSGPESAFVLQGLAIAQAAAGKTEAAIGTLGKLKGLDGEVYGEMVSYQSAQIYEAAGQKDKAKAAYEQMLAAYPDSKQSEFVKMRLDLM